MCSMVLFCYVHFPRGACTPGVVCGGLRPRRPGQRRRPVKHTEATVQSAQGAVAPQKP